MRTNTVLGVPFDAMTAEEAMKRLTAFLEENRNHIIVTPNPEAVMQAGRDPDFAQALLDADARLPDGIGIILASWLLGERIPCRLRGIDTTLALFEKVREQHRTAYFLGAAPGVAERAKANMERQYPGLTVIGCHDGYFNAEEEIIILNEIRALQPDILLVGMGMPKQELWAAAHRDLPVRLTLCLGGSIDVMAGEVKLAPAFLRRIGLEWLYRLLSEPSRAKRMLDLPRFMIAVVQQL